MMVLQNVMPNSRIFVGIISAVTIKDIDETPNDWMKMTADNDTIEIQLYDETS